MVMRKAPDQDTEQDHLLDPSPHQEETARSLFHGLVTYWLVPLRTVCDFGSKVAHRGGCELATVSIAGQGVPSYGGSWVVYLYLPRPTFPLTL